jgi:diguanylate cyclase (GGDEF)-like protein/PAS domain S-box-containing protein
MSVRILIADDHAIFRESLRHMLELDPDMTVVGTVGNATELLEKAELTRPDVVCMDIMMPGTNGIEATRRLVASQPGVKVIGLSAYPDRRYVLEMLNAGARGYVTKSEAPAELQTAIHSVCQDQIYFCPEVSGSLLDPLHVKPPGEITPSLRFQPGSREVQELLAEIRQISASSSTPIPSADEFLRLHQIVEGSSVPTFVLDQRHVVTHWNKACETLTGIPAAEVVGTQDHWRPFHSERRPIVADLILDGAQEYELEDRRAEKFCKSKLVNGAYEAEEYFPKIGENGAWIFFTVAPIHDSQGRLIGTVETLQDFTARHQEEAQLKESEARYRQLSITDNLTGLFNTRHFYDRLKMEIGRAIRYDHPLSLMMMDVDNFKRYNDTYGHLEGDQVLRQLAEVIRICPRQGDSGYRTGGEEFAVMMPDTDLESAKQAAERLRATFAEQIFTPKDGQTIRCSVSIGVTHYRPYEKLTTLIRRCDEGCYEAKHQGKNRVVVA